MNKIASTLAMLSFAFVAPALAQEPDAQILSIQAKMQQKLDQAIWSQPSAAPTWPESMHWTDELVVTRTGDCNPKLDKKILTEEH